MSSTIFAVCGSSSLTQAPDCPCWLNLKIDDATGSDVWPDVMPVMRWPMRTESGSSRALVLLQLGLVVEQVDLRRPAGLVQVDDALGLGREVRQPGQAAGFGFRLRLAANSGGFSSEASAAAPRPVALRPKKCRRVRASFNSSWYAIASLFRDRFVQVQDGAGDGGPGGQLGCIQLRVHWRFAHAQQLLRGLAVFGEAQPAACGPSRAGCPFLRPWACAPWPAESHGRCAASASGPASDHALRPARAPLRHRSGRSSAPAPAAACW